jgi:hypothetical protein
MNQGKMRKVSTYSFSNIKNSSQEASQVQMSKLDTLQVRNDLNYMITKLHNHWTAKKDLSNFAKSYSLISKNLSMSKTCQNGKATQTS